MSLREVSYKLAEGITVAEQAQALGVSENTVFRARMDPSMPNARPAPSGWQRPLADLAERRAREFADLAARLRSEAD